MTYIVVSVVLCAFIAVAWWACRLSKPKDSETFVLEQNLGDLIEWGPPGVGKVYPAATIWCDVCGVWAPHTTCSDCVTWAEVQVIHYKKKLPSFELAFREHKRLVDAAGW